MFYNIYLYSKLKFLKAKKKEFELYVYGNPILYMSSDGTESWINNTLEELNNCNISYEEYFRERLKNTSGLYSLIFITKDKVILACDVVRSSPLLFGYNKGKLFVTDNIEIFQKQNGSLDIDKDRFDEFFAYGNVFGRNTLYKSVYALQAGEIVSIEKDKFIPQRYFAFVPEDKPFKYNTQQEFTHALDDLFFFIFSRLVSCNSGVKNWVVPLSGGHDSRLIVNYLYRLGLRNVICYSYGIKGNEQSEISKKVSLALGYRWYFVEYSAQKWNELHKNGLFGEYIDFAFNGISTPHLQDFLAVYELKKKGIIKEGDVFLPGHTAITESSFEKETLNLKTKKEAIEYVFSRIIEIKPGFRQKKEKVLLPLENIYEDLTSSPEYFMTLCNWQEKNAKFFSNSVRVYDFFGFRSFQPMWDMELVDFWLQMPAEKRIDREPVYQTEKCCALVKELKDIPYASEHENNIKDYFKNIIKGLLPEQIIIIIIRLMNRKAYFNEGTNQYYSLSARSVKELLNPVTDFPDHTQDWFNRFLGRFTYQMNPNIITALYTIRRMLNRYKYRDKVLGKN